jgi:hypothetical protein
LLVLQTQVAQGQPFGGIAGLFLVAENDGQPGVQLQQVVTLLELLRYDRTQAVSSGDQIQGTLGGSAGLGETAHPQQCPSQGAMRLGEFGVDGDGFTEGGDGPLPVPFSEKCHTQVVMGAGKHGVDGNRLTVGSDRSLQVSPGLQSHSQVGVGLGIVGVESNGLAMGGDGAIPVLFSL